MITLRNITLRRGQKLLLKDSNWTIYHKQHIGIIGENGSGKSSLFAMLLGELAVDGGELEIPSQLKFSHMAQETPSHPASALEFVLAGDAELTKLYQELAIAEQENNGSQIAVIHERLSEIDAYTASSRAAQLLSGLGFNQHHQQQAVSSFSGGWRVRLNLARALMSRADVLLLDEPTNHLDLDAVLWLERWLIKYPGTLLLISHDRDFLDHVVDHIVYFSQQQLQLYTGNYSSFEKQRAATLTLQQAAYEKQQKQVAHMEAFVNRFRAKASKAKQAQSRLKALERMELLSAVHLDSPLQFSFREPGKCPNPLLILEEATIAYGDKIVLSNIQLRIAPNDRIALLGPNGAGKSSLIKLLAGELHPSSGIRELSAGVKIGYFAQHQIDHLQLGSTPLNHLQKIAPQTREQELRNFLGSFGFPGDEVKATVANFSGGEKSRLALALLVWQRPNLLLLDEPTNHLDLDMRHALSLALQDYQGAMILVSHDRFLLRTTVDSLLLVAEGKVQEFTGDLSEYERWLLEFRRQTSKEKVSAPIQTEESRKEQRQQQAKQRDERRPLLVQIKKLDTELGRLQQKMATIEPLLADPMLYTEQNKEQLQQLLLQQATLKQQIQDTEEAWLQVHEKLESP